MGSARPRRRRRAQGPGLGTATLAARAPAIVVAATDDRGRACAGRAGRDSAPDGARGRPFPRLVDGGGRAARRGRRGTAGAGMGDHRRPAQLALGHELVGAARQCSSWRGCTRWSASSSGDRSARSRPSATAWRRPWWPSRWPTPLLHAAWDDGSPTTAAMAKAVAGRAARTASRHCQQVLAGIGFTTEHPFQRYLRRVLLDQLFGSGRSLTRQLGAGVLESGTLPAAFPL